jgi:DNA transposition AAA+ family ATPase
MNDAELDDESAATARPIFLITKEYRRFAEFCDACRHDRYVGVCYGPPGVGKTLSARHYARWDDVEDGLEEQRTTIGADIRPEFADCHTLVYTPKVATTPRRLSEELGTLVTAVNDLVRSARRAAELPAPTRRSVVELLIVDEADRLKMPELEEIRDRYDRANFGDGAGVVLIGLPGIEKRLARYPQLYSRIGFVHRFRPLSEEELRFILAHKWRELGLTFSPDDWTDAEAVAAIARITGGNFRLVQRLFAQIARVLAINRLQTITKEVVETARENLVIGP